MQAFSYFISQTQPVENFWKKVLTNINVSYIIEVTNKRKEQMDKELAKQLEEIDKIKGESKKIQTIQDEITELMNNLEV